MNFQHHFQSKGWEAGARRREGGWALHPGGRVGFGSGRDGGLCLREGGWALNQGGMVVFYSERLELRNKAVEVTAGCML